MSDVSEKAAMVDDVIDNLLPPLYDDEFTRPSNKNLRQFLGHGGGLDSLRKTLENLPIDGPIAEQRFHREVIKQALTECQARVGAAKHKAVEDALRSLVEHRKSETADLEALIKDFRRKADLCFDKDQPYGE